MNHALLKPLIESDHYMHLRDSVRQTKKAVWANGVVQTAKWHLTAGLIEDLKRPALIVASSELKAKEIYEDLYYFFKERCMMYPSRDFLFYAADVKSVDITRQRIQVLDRLKNYDEAPIIVLSSEALVDRMVPPETFYRYRFSLSVGDVCEIDTAARKLTQMGYERSGLVEGPGQFAIRGGILDIYPAVAKAGGVFSETECMHLSEGMALRVEFFGDDVDSIRVFDALSQRSIENAQTFEIYPIRELVFSRERLKNAKMKITQALQEQIKSLSAQSMHKEAKTLSDTMDYALARFTDDLGAGADAFFPYFYDEDINLFNYLPEKTLVVFDDPNPIAIHMQTMHAEYQESVSHRLMAGRMLPHQVHVLMEWETARSKANQFPRILFSGMSGKLLEFDNTIDITFHSRSCMPLRHKPSELKEDINHFLKNNYQVALLAGPRRNATHLAEAISAMGLLSQYTDTLEEQNLAVNLVTVSRGTISAGFEYPDIKLVVISDKELFTQEKQRRRVRRKEKHVEKINHFSDLRIGDYIVHDNHGIGVFKGIEQVVSDGLTRDYLKLEYADGGHLYIQSNQMEVVQKYIGKAETKLSKLGGEAWNKAKSKARQAVEILAQDLIDLYAKRQASSAHAYAPDTVWQTEFESAFPYNETDDQLSAIEDVKRDMESKRVMDRLICGDVGYGKTEIAIRAAFKAVQDGKQVAYLVPTTILAQQHYETFAKRMKDYPISVERLSRFQSKKQQTQAIKNMEKGSSDIVIGTHRLLSKDVHFKDLGLVIIDEEQRFGVGHKEKFKALRNNVEVLTLTATPIPRTLHFSLSGIRDISILDEPPHERQPIQTYVMEQNQEFVRDAISRELARGGQVYYLHNRVKNIAEEAYRVAQLVPHARVSYAHGQMSETELENVMHQFIDGDIDVLVCTTIVETGLDIANVNTIIIQNADQMGLAQLYQLRGRVGRSSRLAYAYLMYKRDKVLKEDAEKRLQTIREFTEFGAGFKIAMRDLEIRGAGNLLGANQHGHMDTVGYDMYTKLLAEAVMELRGTPMPEAFETAIEITVDAFIPSRLIPDEQQKLEMYKKISLIASAQDYYDVQEEIEDRYGTIPPPVARLLDVALMKAQARALGVTTIGQKGKNIIITFKADAAVDLEKLKEQLQLNPARLLFTMANQPYITIRAYKDEKPPEDGGTAKIKEIRELLTAIT